MVPRKQVPALCPLLLFLAHTCAPARTRTHALSPDVLWRSPRSGVGRQSHCQEQVEEHVSDCVCDGGHGKGERLYGSHEHYSSICVVDVAGVCVCTSGWLKWAANIIISEDSPTRDIVSSLAGS